MGFYMEPPDVYGDPPAWEEDEEEKLVRLSAMLEKERWEEISNGLRRIEKRNDLSIHETYILSETIDLIESAEEV